MSTQELTVEWFRKKLVSLIDSAVEADEPDFSAAATLMKLAASHLPRSGRLDLDPNQLIRQMLDDEGVQT